MVSPSDNEPADRLQRIDGFSPRQALTALLAALLAAPLVACTPVAAPEPVMAAAADEAPAKTVPGCGRLSAALYGSVETHLDWAGAGIECASMPRPDDAGLRLVFTGSDRGERVSLIISLPDIEPGVTAEELPTKLTLTVADTGRFFSTPDVRSCWSDIRRNDAGPEGTVQLAGETFCVTPLGEFNGNASIQLQELQFETVMTWTSQ
jgi:hypothetical protein